MNQRKRIIGIIIIVLVAATTGATVYRESTTPAPIATPTATAMPTSTVMLNWGVQTSTSGCVASNGLPDRACTPGDIIVDATVSQICTPGYTRSVRNVSTSEKQAVYAEYGIASHSPGQYEVDHLVPLELGGSNDIANLWPESAIPVPGFHQKDAVENWLHARVCSGAESLTQAQTDIATNWLAVYQKMEGTAP